MRPLVSPTSRTWSPTTTPCLPSSRARIAVTSTGPPSGPSTRTVIRPRSTATTSPGTASACAGRVRVRGREPRRLGRTRTSSSSERLSCRRPLRCPLRPARRAVRPALDEVGQRLVDRARVGDLRRPRSPARGRRPRAPCGGRRRSPAAPARPRAGLDDQPVGQLLHSRADRRQHLVEGLQPVGLVAAQVADAGQPRGAVGQRAQRGEDRGQLAHLAEVGDQRRDRAGAGDLQAVRRSRSTSAPIAAEQPVELGAGLGGDLRPVAHGHPPAGDQRRGEERGGVGEVGLDDDVAGGDRPGRHPPAAVGGGDLDAVLAQRRHGHLDVRHRRHAAGRATGRGPRRSGRRPAAARRRSARTRWRRPRPRPPRTRPVPCTVNGARPRPPSSIPTPSAAQRGEQAGVRAVAQPRVAVHPDRAVGQRGDRRQEAQHRAGQAGVDLGRPAQRPRA